MEHKINKSRMLLQFEQELKANEKSAATIAKYCQDILRFMEYARDGSEITKEMVIAYKQNLSETYAVTSANSKLASVNCFLRVIGRADCVVKTFKVQRTAFRAKECELSKKEYIRLLKAAEKKGNTCLCLIMQTICATGIRISELQYFTVEILQGIAGSPPGKRIFQRENPYGDSAGGTVQKAGSLRGKKRRCSRQHFRYQKRKTAGSKQYLSWNESALRRCGSGKEQGVSA